MPTTQDPTGAIHIALDTYLQGLTNSGLTFVWENTPFDPEATGGPYAQAQMLARTQQATGPGRDSPVFHSGVYQVLVSVPTAGEGVGTELTMASAVAQYFKRGTYMSVSTGDYLKVEITNILPSYGQGKWRFVPVQVHWFYHQS